MGQDNTAAAIVDLLRNVTEFQANRYHADLPVMFIINRCENAQRFGKKAAINGNVFLSLQREQNVIAFERLADSLRFWVRITDALHVGHHNKQKAIMLAHRFGERLNAAFRRRFFSPSRIAGESASERATASALSASASRVMLLICEK